MQSFFEISTFLTLQDILSCRCVSKLFAAVVADVRLLSIPASVHKLKRIIDIFPKLRIAILHARASLSPSFFEGVDGSSLELSKICASNIGHVSSLWSGMAQGQMSFPSVSQVECKSIGGIAGDALLNLFYCFPSLRSLKLYDCLAVDDALLASVSDRLQMLKDVSVSKSSQLKNVEIGSTKLTIRHLTLSMCPTLSMINVPMSLISIVLSGTAVTDAAVSGVVKVCTAIILIDVSHCHALRDLTINSSTIAILNFDYSSSLRSLCVECPLLQSIGVSGCASLVQLVLCSGSICHIDLTMLKSLKCVELRCDHLQSLLACGCENMKYFGRYLSEDYKRITLGIVLASCPFLRLGNGDCLAGCPLYDEYINSFGI